MGTDCVLCEVGTEVAYAILKSVTLQWFTAMQEVCPRVQIQFIVSQKNEGFLIYWVSNISVCN
jgi:hypothetical protein